MVGNICCSNPPSLVSSEAAANGVADQPEMDPAHHHSEHSRLGTASKGNQPRRSKAPSLHRKWPPTISAGLKKESQHGRHPPALELLPPERLGAPQTAQQPYNPWGTRTFPVGCRARLVAAEDRPPRHTAASHPGQEEWAGSEAESRPGRRSKGSAPLAGGCWQLRAAQL